LKKLIYSKEDLDLILCLETEKYEDKINNLQSKIDKAIEYVNTIKDNTPNSTRKDFAKMILINYEFLLSILKEDK
jgi:hypothetical protein